MPCTLSLDRFFMPGASEYCVNYILIFEYIWTILESNVVFHLYYHYQS